MRGHRRALIGLLTLASWFGASLCVVPAANATSAFTWTGASSNAEPKTPASNSEWTTVANWNGVTAPATGETVDLSFPAAACTPACAEMLDDIPGLSVDTLTLEDTIVASPVQTGPPGPPPISTEPSSYSIAGTDALTLTGGIDVLTSTIGSGPGISSSPMQIAVPILLGAANSWSLASNTELALTKSITGAYPLDITNHGDSLELYGADEVGPLTITGGGVSIGTPNSEGDLNGGDQEPVTLNNAFLSGRGNIGPLNFNDGFILVGFPGFGDLHIEGALTLSGDTRAEFERLQSGETATQITVEGAANLGSATLRLPEGCVAPGNVFTLLRAQGGISGVFTDLTGARITDGETIQPATSECGASSPELPLQINYSANAVTATVLPAPAAPQAPGGSQTHTTQNTQPGAGVASYSVSQASVAGALAQELAPANGATTLTSILRHGGLWISFRALEAGTAVVDWYAPPTHTHGARAHSAAQALLIAQGRLRFTVAGTAKLFIKLTERGRKLLKGAKRLRITAQGTFSSAGPSRVNATRTFNLSR
jgi:hypothetical protein